MAHEDLGLGKVITEPRHRDAIHVPVTPVTAARTPGGVEVTVRDDGTGIDAAHRERIFRPYFTTKKQGTGLGLFVTHKIVGEHGGSVEFESEPGKGTTFRVRLPVAGG